MFIFLHAPAVVYFDQHLGSAHSKCWLNHAFSMFLHKKCKKGKKARKNLRKWNVTLLLLGGSNFYFFTDLYCAPQGAKLHMNKLFQKLWPLL